MRLLTFLILLCAPVFAQTVDSVYVEVAPGVVVELSDLDSRDARMATPLHRAAAATTDPELIRMMLARGADPGARDAEGRTPLHDAAAAGAPLGVLAALLGGGADPTARDAAGETPLALAATAEAAALLTVVGGDPCATDAGGSPALTEAMLESIREQAPDLYPRMRDAYLGCL
jgi:ankyrin repeat protein